VDNYEIFGLEGKGQQLKSVYGKESNRWDGRQRRLGHPPWTDRPETMEYTPVLGGGKEPRRGKKEIMAAPRGSRTCRTLTVSAGSNHWRGRGVASLINPEEGGSLGKEIEGVKVGQ